MRISINKCMELQTNVSASKHKETKILGGYENLCRHGKKLLFINAATRRGIPLQ